MRSQVRELSSPWTWARKAVAFRCLRWVGGQPEIRTGSSLREFSRDEGSGLRWDIAPSAKAWKRACALCAQLAPEGIAAIGVDGWAVDYVRLGAGRTTGRESFLLSRRTHRRSAKACALPHFSRTPLRTDRSSDPFLEHAVSVARGWSTANRVFHGSTCRSS